ncbi:MAG TPA: PAS domain S-box protein [Aggregatilineales bacterium]|nr:PAS domain S-box protein [Anaerolineae bacterium]HUN05233.1 PAS domain S-box protein [Aggregatilineales bacterium]
MANIFNRLDVRITLFYGLFASLWIVGSDTIVAILQAQFPSVSDSINTYKGLGFVFITTLLLFIILRQGLRQQMDKEAALAAEVQRTRYYSGQLEESEARFRKAVEEAPVPVMIFAEDGEVISVSRAWAEITGYTSEQLKTLDSWTELAYGERKQLVRAVIDQLFSIDHRIDEGEFTVRCADGSQRIWAFSSTPLGRDSANRRMVISIAADVSERKQAEEQVKIREARFHLLFNSNPHPMWVYAPASLRFLEVNHAATEQYGYTKAEFLSMTLLDIRPEEDHQRLRDAVQQVRPVFQHSGNWRHRKKNGQIIEVEITSHTLEYDSHEAVLVVAQDITLRRATENALRESEERFRLFIEHAPAALAMLDKDMRYLAVSRRWFNDYRLENPDIIGRSHYEVFPETPDRWKVAHQLGLSGIVQRSEEDAFKRLDGSVQWLHWEIHPWHNSENVIGGIIIFSEDITQRKFVEVALRDSEQRYRLLAENAQDLIYRYVFAPKPGFEYVSPSATKMTGYTPEEHYADPDLGIKLVHPEDRALLQQVSSAGDDSSHSIVIRWIRKDGSILWAEQHNVLIYDQAGKAVALEGIARDITERKNAEEHIRYLANLVESASDAIISTDLQFVVRSWNKAAENLYGWSASEALGKPLNSIIETTYLNNDGPSVMEHFRSKGEWRGEVIQSHRDGTPIDVLSSVALAYDGHGNPIGAIGINRDIRARKQAEQALRFYTERLTILRQIDIDIIKAHSPENISTNVLNRIRDLIPYDSASIILIDETADTATIYTSNYNEAWLVANETVIPLVRNRSLEMMRMGQLLIVSDLMDVQESLSELGQKALQMGLRATLNAPLTIQDTLLGLLSMASKTPNFFTAEHGEIAQEIANQLAIAFQNARMTQTLQEKNQLLQATSALLVETQENERRHIARELHDEVGQTLTALNLMLEMYRRRTESDQETRELNEAHNLVTDLMKRIREISLDLRPSMLDDLGLVPTLIWYFKRYKLQTAIEIDFRHSGVEQRYAPMIETTVYRIIQEALTNVARHAQVAHASVQLWANSDVIHVQIEDNGKGFDLKTSPLEIKTAGLLGMRERTEIAGGKCKIESSIGSGTIIGVTIPVELPHKPSI